MTALTHAPTAAAPGLGQRAWRGRPDDPAWARPALPVLIHGAGEVRLPAPLGRGPATARSLAEQRLAAACGLIAREGEIGDSRHGAERLVTLC